MKIKIGDKNGVLLKTENKYVAEDIEVGLTKADQDALVPNNLRASILGVEAGIQDYDGSYDGGTDKWWAEDFINEIYNQYKTDDNYVMVYLLSDDFDEVELYTQNSYTNTTSSMIYFSDGEVWNAKTDITYNVSYWKKWDTSKDIVISDEKIRYFVRVQSGKKINGYDFYSRTLSYSTLGIIADSNFSAGSRTGSDSTLYNFINLEFYDFRTNETSIRFNYIVRNLKYIRIPDTVDTLEFQYVTPNDLPINLIEQIIKYNFKYYKYGSTKTSCMNNWKYEKYFKTIDFGTSYSSIEYLFGNNTKLKDLKQIPDISTVTSLKYAFRNCDRLLKTSNVLINLKPNIVDSCFYSCYSLRDVELNLIACVDYSNTMLYQCYSLTNLTLLNIKANLSVGNSNLLTLESILNTCQECINMNASRTLTIGSTNVNKLTNVYVKLTGEAEENETLPKLPFVQCESTDEAAMTISEYMLLKNWSIA